MSRDSVIWLDGTPTTVLPIPDRGLDFGDGLFETLLVYQGKPLFEEIHMERLAQGLRALILPDCLQLARSQLNEAAAALQREWIWAVMRLTVIRGTGVRGYAASEGVMPRILICATRLDRDGSTMANAATLGVAKIRLAPQPALARIKHLNRLEQVLAAIQTQEEGTDESIMLDHSGCVTSVVAGNVFLVSGDELLTPSLYDCGVAGTRRRLIIDRWAPSIGLKTRETRISLSDLNNAQEIFYSNSLLTIRPVASLGGLRWDQHCVSEALFQRYLDELN